MSSKDFCIKKAFLWQEIFFSARKPKVFFNLAALPPVHSRSPKVDKWLFLPPPPPPFSSLCVWERLHFRIRIIAIVSAWLPYCHRMPLRASFSPFAGVSISEDTRRRRIRECNLGLKKSNKNFKNSHVPWTLGVSDIVFPLKNTICIFFGFSRHCKQKSLPKKHNFYNCGN